MKPAIVQLLVSRCHFIGEPWTVLYDVYHDTPTHLNGRIGVRVKHPTIDINFFVNRLTRNVIV